MVGLTQLGFVTAAGLPILVLMAAEGMIFIEDAPVLLAMPFYLWCRDGIGVDDLGV